MSRESLAARRARADKIQAALDALYPDARCTLDYRSAYELWVATVLSAQSTDERVNQVTPALFAAAPDAAALARLPRARLEALIRALGLYRSKAKNLAAAARTIESRHGGKIPDSMAQLVSLPGIGRKSANVILGNAYGVPGFPVDTHVGRLARRLGFSRETDPAKVESDLSALFAPGRWTRLSHQLIRHGREICASRKPRCAACPLAELCPSAGKN